MSVYRNLVVEIPKEHVTIERQPDGKPALIKYVLTTPYDREKGYAVPKRTTIGHQCEGSTTTMHPTTAYARIFPDQWKKIAGEENKPSVIRIGMFSACQAVCTKTGLKEILDSVYGEDAGNALLDQAMDSILSSQEDPSSFELLYCREPKSNFLRTEEEDLLFMRRWILHCREKGTDTALLRFEKTPDNICIHALTPDGMPLTYGTHEVREILELLQVSAVLADEECSHAEIQNVPLGILIKGIPKPAKDLAFRIRQNPDFLLPHTFLFAGQMPVQFPESTGHTGTLTLFYDFQKESDGVSALLEDLYQEMHRLEKCLQEGKPAVVKDRYKEVLTVADGPQINSKGLKPLMEEMGFYAILTSSEMKPEEVHSLFAPLEEVRPGSGLIESILRYEMEKATEESGCTLDEVIRELEQMEARRVNDVYTYQYADNDILHSFFYHLDADPQKLTAETVKLANDRLSGRIPKSRRRKAAAPKDPHPPGKPGVKKGTKRQDFNQDGTPRKKPGVKPGTKRNSYNKDGSVRKKPGPKPKTGNDS